MNTVMQLKEVVELLTGVRRGADPAVFLSDAVTAGLLKADGSPVTSKGNDWETVFNDRVDNKQEFFQAGLVAYDRLSIEYYLQPDLAADYFEFRGSANGGGSYSTASGWAQFLNYIVSPGSALSVATLNQAFYAMSFTNTIPTKATIDYGMSGRFFMHNWNKPVHKIWSNDVGWYQATSGQVLTGRDGGYNNERGIWDSLQIKLHNGGPFSGRIHIQGLKG